MRTILTCLLSEEADGNAVRTYTHIGHGSNPTCVGGEWQEAGEIEVVGGRYHLEALASANKCDINDITSYDPILVSCIRSLPGYHRFL